MFCAPVCGSWTPSFASSRTTEFGMSIVQPPAVAAGVLHRELDAVDDRLGGRELTALLGKLDADVDRALAAGAPALVATGEHEHADGGERADLAVVSFTLLLERSSTGWPRTTSVGAPSSSGPTGCPARRSAARCVASRCALRARQEGRGRRSAVRDGRRDGTLVRTARRLPPKRCRIIDIGGPNATPVGATRAWLSSLLARHPARCHRPQLSTVGSRSAKDANQIVSAASHEVSPPAWNT